MTADLKARDLELWRVWNRGKGVPDLETLMGHMRPVIQREVGRWSKIVPEIVVESEAKRLALKAFHSFDPNRGVQLSTHVVNQLQPLSRMAYARQSTMSIPEHQRLTYNRYLRARAQLEDELGRPPSIEHLADRLALPMPKLQQLVTNVERRELMESGEGPAFQQGRDDEDQLIELAYHDLTPLQKQVFDLRTGSHGHAETKNPDILRQLGITQGQLSYELTKVRGVLEQARRMR